MMENPITSGQGSLSGAFRPRMNILAIPPVIESKHTLNVRVSAPQAQINVNISSQVARNNMKKSNLWVPRMYGNCKWLSELLQNAANYGKKDDGKRRKTQKLFVLLMVFQQVTIRLGMNMKTNRTLNRIL